MPTSTALLQYIFPNTRLPLALQFAGWLDESPRFRAFAETYRDKIRKKVRGVSETEGYQDLQAELSTAYFLVQERRFVVEYEKYGIGKQRGPDFSVVYKTHVRFDVEVTRLHSEQAGMAPDTTKVANTLCAKLLQLPPSTINVLVLVVDATPYPPENLAAAHRFLLDRAERKDDEFFARRGFAGTRDFFRYYHRLSATRLVTAGEPPSLHLQPQARHPLPADLATLLRRQG